ncbi:MAG: hypothetical protein K8R63_02095 [Bacteroidales bacterium]|nr:hypothetical protein [Bacteroidales bacterium]
MAHYIHFRDPNSKEIEEKLAGIPKCPGTCFFIDVINSTDIKYKTDFSDWGKQLNNTFNFISFLNDFPDNVVKGIGDELMLYIPDEDLFSKTAYNNYFALLEEIYATIDNLVNYPVPNTFLNCKVSIHYCTEVYNISYFEHANDYYGIDIDLTARLMSKAKANRIVMSEKFFTKVKNDLVDKNLRIENTSLANISPVYMEDFKGVPYPTEYRFLDIG